MTIKRLLVANDLHAGSPVAPCPDKFVTSHDTLYYPNRAQRYLNECWAHMQTLLPPLDAIIFNGDMTDGIHRKSNAMPVFEPNIAFQGRIALELCAPLKNKLVPGGKIYCTEGTEYHVGIGGIGSEAFAKAIGAEQAPNGHYAWDWLLLEIDGITLDIHHAASHFMVYRTTPLMRELDHSLLRTAKMREPMAYGIIRGHTHSEYVVVEEGMRTAIAVPSWQIQTDFATRGKTPNRMISTWIGSVIVEIDADALERNQPPVTFKRLNYRHPQKDRVKL